MKLSMTNKLTIASIIVTIIATALTIYFGLKQLGFFKPSPSVNELILILKDIESDNNKIDYIKDTKFNLEDINFSDLLTILRLFKFDNSRLEAFKLLYHPDIEGYNENLVQQIRDLYNFTGNKEYVVKILRERK
jgi:hypothetical protein